MEPGELRRCLLEAFSEYTKVCSGADLRGRIGNYPNLKKIFKINFFILKNLELPLSVTIRHIRAK